MKTLARAAIAAVLALAPGAAARADLVGLYQFNNSTNLGLDTSGHGNNLTNNGATYTSAGYQGGAASFNGTSAFLQSSFDVGVTSLPQMTWGAWVMPTATDPIRAVLSTDNGGFDRDLDLDSRGGSTSWSAFTGNGVLGSGVAPSTSAWTFLAAVYNQASNSMTFYVNGTSVSTTTNFGSSYNFFEVGANPGFGQYYGGLIDNVFVYNTALTAQQVATIQATGFPTGSSVPEPSTLALAGLGMVSVALMKWRKRARA